MLLLPMIWLSPLLAALPADTTSWFNVCQVRPKGADDELEVENGMVELNFWDVDVRCDSEFDATDNDAYLRLHHLVFMTQIQMLLSPTPSQLISVQTWEPFKARADGPFARVNMMC